MHGLRHGGRIRGAKQQGRGGGRMGMGKARICGGREGRFPHPPTLRKQNGPKQTCYLSLFLTVCLSALSSVSTLPPSGSLRDLLRHYSFTNNRSESAVSHQPCPTWIHPVLTNARAAFRAVCPSVRPSQSIMSCFHPHHLGPAHRCANPRGAPRPSSSEETRRLAVENHVCELQLVLRGLAEPPVRTANYRP